MNEHVQECFALTEEICIMEWSVVCAVLLQAREIQVANPWWTNVMTQEDCVMVHETVVLVDMERGGRNLADWPKQKSLSWT